ncbi:asparaginase [Candidatus Neomarinimicrobiota bacterium]
MQCRVTRGSTPESVHEVYVVAVDEKDNILYNSGSPDYLTCARSSLKPFQAAASVEIGAVDAAKFSETELALMCASHSGEAIHVKTAQGMLNKLGTTPDVYECGIHLPYNKETSKYLTKNESELSPLHNNCSGKHAGMLCLSKFLKVDPTGYTKPDHPVQKTILKYLKQLTGLKNMPIGIDGCSAATPFLSLYAISVLFKKLGQKETPALKSVYEAMVNNPYLIGGKKRFDTDFIAALKGRAVAKIGGEAIQGIAFQQGNGKSIGIALKVLDGNPRCLPVAIMSLLKKLDLLSKSESDQLKYWATKKLFNHRKLHIGNILVDFN